LAGLDRLAVDPVGRVAVALDLEVLAQLLVADRAALGEELFDLLEDQRVALDCGGVVRLLEPDAAPESLGMGRRWQAAKLVAKLDDLGVQPLVERLASRTATPRASKVVWFGHIRTVPNNR